MKPENILSNIPVGLQLDINGDHYNYAIQDIEAGTLTLSTNGNELQELHFRDVPENLKAYFTHLASETYSLKLIEETLGRTLHKDEKAHYLTAWRLLNSPDNAFFKLCISLIGNYHALDVELAQMLLLGTTRSRFSSTSALIHIDATGASGAGKDDLVSRVMTLVPPHFVVMYSSVSPMAPYYDVIEEREEGKTIRQFANPDHFRGLIICITEIADSATFSALKALAEIDETKESTQVSTYRGKNLKMTIRGARSVVITSVDGINDTQVKRRFIHASVSSDDKENVSEKVEIAHRLMVNNLDMRDDPLTPTARAGIDLVFSTRGLVFEKMRPETEALLLKLEAAFFDAGYGLTNYKQFYALAECLAIWSRFRRGEVRIYEDDLLGAWSLLSTFEKETISRTTLNGVEVLKTVKKLNDEAEEQAENDTIKHEPIRPTRAEISKDSKVPQSTIYRLLRTKSDVNGKLGELLELGYVTVSYSDNKECIELSDLGASVLREVPKSVEVNGKICEPLEPIRHGLDPDVLECDQIERITERYEEIDSEKGVL